ncbi:MAG: DUF1553 domain-containing protein [Fuerstiella sp.]|nr:DUF1553 domain-containing protein [Fuerstiella sp.]
MNRWFVPAILTQLIVTFFVSGDLSAEIVEIIADPGVVQLNRPRADFQLLIDARNRNGTVEDVTATAVYESLSPEIATVDRDGLVRAVSDGSGQIRVTFAGHTSVVDVVVSDSDSVESFDFENDITPCLTRFGCNMAACHAKAEGQNGLKFSVFGYDPRADFEGLLFSSRGRRVSLAAPARSLFLLKATQTIAHTGGQRIKPGSDAYQTLLKWVEAGAPFRDENAPRITGIEITPGQRQIKMNASQQLRVTAVFSDGTRKDVTRMARYRSNNDGLATVDRNGRITIGVVPGQVAVMAMYLGAVDTFVTYIPQATPVDPYPELPENNFIDSLVHKNLEKLHLLPSESVKDSDFLRRAYIDIIGTLPTVQEARVFLMDENPRRRELLVDELLERQEYAIYWALKWSDLLHVDRAILGHRRAYAFYRWIRDGLANDRPMDEFARAIVTADGPLDESPEGGFYQALVEPGDRASAFSQVFLGIRIDCAECHHHPFDRWSQQDYYGMTAYFARIKAQPAPTGDVLVMDTTVKTIHPRTGAEVTAQPLGGWVSSTPVDGDPRHGLATWLTAPDNPWFARNLANRTWGHFFGRGLVEPVDDVRQTNPSSNSMLLGELASWLQAHDYDMKSLIRVITSSQAYQRTAQTNSTNETDVQNASRALLKPLDAEVLLDAISQTTGIPARFDGAAAGTRAIELWDSKLQHPFLRLFGRPERKTACECERVSEPSISQVLHIMNSPKIYARLNHQGGTVSRLVREIPENSRLAEELYLTFLSRFPSASERQVIDEYFVAHSGSRRDAAVDLAWSLINSLEFSFNH